MVFRRVVRIVLVGETSIRGCQHSKCSDAAMKAERSASGTDFRVGLVDKIFALECFHLVWFWCDVPNTRDVLEEVLQMYMRWEWFVAGASVGFKMLLGVFVFASPSTVDVLWGCSSWVLLWTSRHYVVSSSLHFHRLIVAVAGLL